MSKFNAETIAEVATNWDRALLKCALDAARASTIAADSYARFGQAKKAADAYALAEAHARAAGDIKNALFLQHYGSCIGKAKKSYE